jgi:phage terminase large subunit
MSIGVNVGEASKFPDRFRNLKAELYWALRERFESNGISGLQDELTISQLASIRYEINARGQVEIESKQALRQRGAQSPDRAEALMLAFADRTPGIITYYKALSKQQDGGAVAQHDDDED